MCDLHPLFSEYVVKHWDANKIAMYEIRFIRFIAVWLRRLQNAYYRDVFANQAALAFEFRRKYVQYMQVLLLNHWTSYFTMTGTHIVRVSSLYVSSNISV